jgi:integrase
MALSIGNVSAAISALMKRLGLSLTFHGLRHTHASHLPAETIHPKVVSERLGHANIGITLDSYSPVLPSLQEEAARKIDESLDRARRRASGGF